MSNYRYRWAGPGDVNAFFGLMLDNIAGLILMVTLLSTVFGFPADFAIAAMVPGTAIGVFVGDLIFFVMAFRLAKRTEADEVTAMPLGLDTPSTFGMVFFVLGPAYVAALGNGMPETAAATQTWHVGIWAIVLSGLFKIGCSFFSHWIRNNVPRAGLLGSLAAIALILISFFPLLDILAKPLVGFVALSIVLTALVGKIPLPGRTPGTLGALLVAGFLFYLLRAVGFPGYSAQESTMVPALFPTAWLDALQFAWLSDFEISLNYLPVVLPFAIATVVGGIDCTESAAAAGDDYPTGAVIGAEGVATLIGGICGGVIQTTPYIGHPAYKEMGGRAAYSLATALFVGAAGVVGFFGYVYQIIPQAAVYPILVFIGLEITAQSFAATPKRHYAAIGLACVPALAFLAFSFSNQVIGSLGSSIEAIGGPLGEKLHLLQILSNGFILTSLLWASALAAIIDHKLRRAGLLFALCGIFTLFGLMHSPFANSTLFLPWSKVELVDAGAEQVAEAESGADASSDETDARASQANEGESAGVNEEPQFEFLLASDRGSKVFEFALGYFLVAGLLIGWAAYLQKRGVPLDAPADDD